jgi:hypothetical protein
VSTIRRTIERLFEPVDIAPLVFFRVAFGLVMLWEVWRYFHYDRIARYYIEPSFYFHYFGFEWLRPLPGDGMFWLFHGIGFLSVLIALGAFYRVSMLVFWLCFTYVFLLDKAQYLNHFYLISLISFLMIFIPAHRALSVDALLRPSIRSQVAPAWALWLLRGQMAVVYFFGGVAKINPDWLAGEPLRQWLADVTDFPLIGHLFTEAWMVYLFSYGGLLLDLLIVPFLLWPRTRIPALLLATAFHLTNARLFNIGIFPWFAIVATLLFMPPHWFRPPPLARLWRKPEGATLAPVGTRARRLMLAGLAAWFAVQIALPLRHWLYPGDPSWTEEGHTLAWHMRLRTKNGDIAFFAGDPESGAMWPVAAQDYLSTRQFEQMKDNPDMILRFAHYLADELGDEHPNVHIHAWAMMSLNSRAAQLLIDPTANLARESDNLLASDWILPLAQHPVPHAGVPALLVSRRYEDVLALVNTTNDPYPLDRLMLRTGNYALAGSAFGVDQLAPGGCVFAHTASADLQTVFVPCNETGARQQIDGVLLEAPLVIDTGTGKAQRCDEARCLVALG